MKKISLIKLGAIMLCLAILSALPACQNSRAQSLIKENEFEKLIENAVTPPPENVNVQDMADDKNADYVADLENADGNIKVKVNASLEIPDTTKLSVYSVKQKPFTQEFIDLFRSELFGDQPIYDGTFFKQEIKINGYKYDIKNANGQALRDEYQRLLDELLLKCNTTADKASLTNFVSDGILRPTKEIYEERPYYEWEYSMYPNGSYLHFVTDGSNEEYAHLEVYNSPEKSNCLSYSKNSDGQRVTNYSVLTQEQFEEHYGSIDKYINGDEYKDAPENYTDTSTFDKYSNYLRYVPTSKETCNLTADEAIQIADGLLERLGITDFECFSSEKTADRLLSTGKNLYTVYLYRTNYTLVYYRKLDGVFLTQSSGSKNNLAYPDVEDMNDFTKKHWYGEKITFKVNDEGVVEFQYLSPLEITGTVVENVAIMPFEKIKPIFENYVASSTTQYHDMTYYRNIEKVRLSYSRISEGKTNYETGLIVPMWDFYGLMQYDLGGLNKGSRASYLAINAIDGTPFSPFDGLY